MNSALSNAENKISLLVILCIIMYVTKRKNPPKKQIQNQFFLFTKPITDYGKMLKYQEKYRSTDILVDLYLLLWFKH